MEINHAADQLRYQGQAILALSEGITEEVARWKPDTESWSILEVLNHLVDEEKLDFRQHLGHILYTPERPWPRIDPQGWATQKAYNQRNLNQTRQEFRSERKKSIAWILGLIDPDWEVSIELSWGALSAGDMLASWLAHDLLHIRQLVELRYDLTARESQPYSLQYAGEW